MKGLLSIVVLNWNGCDDTLLCLESAQKTTYRPFEVIVVDNGSTDNSVETIKKRFPEVQIVQNSSNLGVGGGYNAGLKRAKGEYIGLLNNDIVLDPDWARVLIAAIKDNPDTAAAFGTIFHWDEEENKPYRTDNTTYSIPYMNPDTGASDIYRQDEREIPDYIPVGAAIIRAEAVKKVGLLDELYFTYYEDVDWSARALRAGYRLLYVPQSKLWHYGNKTTGTHSRRTLFMNRRNQLMFITVHFDRKHLFPALWLQFKYLPKMLGKFVLFHYSDRLDRDNVAMYLKGTLAYLGILPQVLSRRFRLNRNFPHFSYNAKLDEIHQIQEKRPNV